MLESQEIFISQEIFPRVKGGGGGGVQSMTIYLKQNPTHAHIPNMHRATFYLMLCFFMFILVHLAWSTWH